MTVIEQSSNVEQALAQIGLFEHLSPEELKKLAIHCRWCSFRPNERIIDPESTTTDVYIVVRGTARIVNHSLSGREISFEDIGSGSYFGELSAIDSQPRSAGAIALDSALLLRLSSRAFVGCVTSDRIAALAVMNRLARMVRQADERIMDLSTLAADLRIYAELLRLAARGVRDDGSAVIRPIPLQGEIASRVSTTRETVGRVMSALRGSNVIRRTRGTLVISNVRQLAEMAGRAAGR